MDSIVTDIPRDETPALSVAAVGKQTLAAKKPISSWRCRSTVSQASEFDNMQSCDQDHEKNTDGDGPLPQISAATLARILGVSPKTVYDLTKAGVLEREGGRLFALEDSVRRYCNHLRRTARGAP